MPSGQSYIKLSSSSLQHTGSNTLSRQRYFKELITILHIEGNPLLVFIEQYQSIGSIGIFSSNGRNASWQIAGSGNSCRTCFESLAQMTNSIEMTTFGKRCIIFGRHIYSTIASGTSTGSAMRASLIVQEEVPYNNRLAAGCSKAAFV